MKSGTITHYVEIPVTVHYTAYPEEKMTLEYPGCPAHVIVDFIGYPDEPEINAIIDSNASAIKEACEEDANQPVDDGI